MMGILQRSGSIFCCCGGFTRLPTSVVLVRRNNKYGMQVVETAKKRFVPQKEWGGGTVGSNRRQRDVSQRRPQALA